MLSKKMRVEIQDNHVYVTQGADYKLAVTKICLDLRSLHREIRQLIPKYGVLYPLRLNPKCINAHT